MIPIQQADSDEITLINVDDNQHEQNNNLRQKAAQRLVKFVPLIVIITVVEAMKEWFITTKLADNEENPWEILSTKGWNILLYGSLSFITTSVADIYIFPIIEKTIGSLKTLVSGNKHEQIEKQLQSEFQQLKLRYQDWSTSQNQVNCLLEQEVAEVLATLAKRQEQSDEKIEHLTSMVVSLTRANQELKVAVRQLTTEHLANNKASDNNNCCDQKTRKQESTNTQEQEQDSSFLIQY